MEGIVMKLYLLTQTAVCGYDTFDSCVVAAEGEGEAKNTAPDGRPLGDQDDTWPYQTACVTAEYLGEAAEGVLAGVICASFNAG